MTITRTFIIALYLCTLTSLTACSSEEHSAGTASSPAIEKDPLTEVHEQLAKDPRNAEAWFHLAEIQERSGQFSEEIASLKKVLELTPDAGYAYLKLGSAYNRLEKYPDAVASFQKAAKRMPQNAVLFNNMAYSYGKLGKTDEEIDSLKQAIEIRPSYSTARYSLGVAYLKRGMVDEAKKQYDKLRTFDEGAAKSLKTAIDARKK